VVFRLARRALAVAIVVGGLSFLGGPPAQATSTCGYVRLYDPHVSTQFCLSNPI